MARRSGARRIGRNPVLSAATDGARWLSSAAMSRADSPLRGRMIFNVGARRSGTYWLQRIVTAHPEVSAVPSETHLFSEGIAPLFERFQHSLRSSSKVGEVYVERERALEATRDLCDAVFADMLDPGTTRLAERTPRHALHLDLIAGIYPDARYVHIIRDGRDAARSIAAQEWGPGNIAEAAAEWRATIVAARNAALPAAIYRELRYEDLMREPGAAVAALYEWLGLPASEEVVAEAVSEAGIGANLGGDPTGIALAKWRDTYSEADLAAFDRAAGDVLRELGYPASEVAPRPRETRTAGPFAAVRARLSSLRGRPARLPRSKVRARPLQELVDEIVRGLQERDFEGLSSLLTRDARVRVVSPPDDEQGRGERGRDVLRRLVARDSVFSGRQERGDVYLALPYAGIVLSYRADSATPDEWIVFIRFADHRVGELVVYEL
jgi:hypothetical protein